MTPGFLEKFQAVKRSGVSQKASKPKPTKGRLAMLSRVNVQISLRPVIGRVGQEVIDEGSDRFEYHRADGQQRLITMGSPRTSSKTKNEPRVRGMKCVAISTSGSRINDVLAWVKIRNIPASTTISAPGKGIPGARCEDADKDQQDHAGAGAVLVRKRAAPAAGMFGFQNIGHLMN